MFETISRMPAPPVLRVAAPGYRESERRSRSRDAANWLTCVLDEIDYGTLLVDADAQVTFTNHAARRTLDSHHPLQLLGRTLRARLANDVAPLYDALAAAQRGMRRLLTLGEGPRRVSVSVVPLPPDDAAGDSRTLLVLGKHEVCAELSVQGFARSVGLTPAETRVLEMLCGGVRPTEIAQRQQVAISTVRTQIGSIRAKTGAASIRDLVHQVAVLPPMVGALRMGVMLAAA